MSGLFRSLFLFFMVSVAPRAQADVTKLLQVSQTPTTEASPAALTNRAGVTPRPGARTLRLLALAPEPSPPSPEATGVEPSRRPSAPMAAVYTAPGGNQVAVTRPQALWHSALLPGWGQWGSDRPVRGATFGALAAAGVFSSILLAVRANDANNTYESATIRCKQAAYGQAVSYQVSRNRAIGLTAALWAVNIAEAYLGHGSSDRSPSDP